MSVRSHSVYRLMDLVGPRPAALVCGGFFVVFCFGLLVRLGLCCGCEFC
jgi:hypothetical protein